MAPNAVALRKSKSRANQSAKIAAAAQKLAADAGGGDAILNKSAELEYARAAYASAKLTAEHAAVEAAEDGGASVVKAVEAAHLHAVAKRLKDDTRRLAACLQVLQSRAEADNKLLPLTIHKVTKQCQRKQHPISKGGTSGSGMSDETVLQYLMQKQLPKPDIERLEGAHEAEQKSADVASAEVSDAWAPQTPSPFGTPDRKRKRNEFEVDADPEGYELRYRPQPALLLVAQMMSEREGLT